MFYVSSLLSIHMAKNAKVLLSFYAPVAPGQALL